MKIIIQKGLFLFERNVIKVNIGIDIDGVLTDLERMQIDFGTKMCVEENWPLNIDLSKYWEIETFAWTQEKADKFWNKYFLEYVVNTEPRMFSKDIIDKLIEEKNNIYIITARSEYGLPPNYYGKIQELTKEWLKKQDIKYDKIIFAKDNEKLPQCIENNIDIMIEDSPNNIKDISKKIKVIKFDCQYNKQVNGDNIFTSYSWYHIYDIINKLKEDYR